MSEQINFEPTPENTVKLLRIILGALMLGVIVTGVFMLPSMLQKVQGAPGAINLIPILIAAGGLMASFIVPQVVLGNAIKTASQGDPSQIDRELLTAFTASRITRGALLEGPAFLNIVMIDPHRPYLHLGIVAILLAGIAFSIPSLSGLNEWLRIQKESLSMEPGSKD
jgi:hypothetical protein